MDTRVLNLKFEDDKATLKVEVDSYYKIVKLEGIESSDYEINVEKYKRYDGGYTVERKVLPRDISIVLDYVNINNANSERQNLIGFFNPKRTGILTINYCGVERHISYEVEGIKDLRGNLLEPLSFRIDLVCPDPYFKGYILGEEIRTWIGGWKFKFKLPFRFKQKGETKKNIVNEGHVETPLEIIFKGPALNPCVINNRTGEFIKVTKELTSDDTLYITTAFGNKKVEIERNGIRSNAFNYIDLDSTFFNLKVGDNMLEYTTDNDLEPQGVEIIYKNRYLGI